MTQDITYTQDGIWTRFFPETDAGRPVWDEMQEDGVAAVLNNHAENVIKQIRSAGYRIAKAKKVTDADMEEIFDLMEKEGL